MVGNWLVRLVQRLVQEKVNDYYGLPLMYQRTNLYTHIYTLRRSETQRETYRFYSELGFEVGRVVTPWNHSNAGAIIEHGTETDAGGVG